MSKLKKTKKIIPRSAKVKKPLSPKKQIVTVSPQSSSARSKHSPTDYYNCLMNYAQAGFYDAQEGKKMKIHACCKKCKLSAPNLNSERDKELVKLITSYKQVGDSLARLLKPLS